MSSTKVSIGNLGKAIQGLLDEYGDEAFEIVSEATEKYTKEALKEVKKASPVDTGRYKKGWRKEITKGRMTISGAVFNKTDYYKTHLLENGHARRGGGREVPAKVHISPVNESIIDKFEKEIKSKL